MIKSFKCKLTEKLYRRLAVKKFSGIESQAVKKLDRLEAATDLRDLALLPGNHFECLKGDRLGQYSIRINDQWRICFKWDKGAIDIEIVDCH